jgi:hypothetical protein
MKIRRPPPVARLANGMLQQPPATVPGWPLDSDEPSVAGQNCDAKLTANPTASCCMFHLYGVGQWFLTDGIKVEGSSASCGAEGNCYAGGNCL